jgi:hypothetical protein
MFSMCFSPPSDLNHLLHVGHSNLVRVVDQVLFVQHFFLMFIPISVIGGGEEGHVARMLHKK